MIECIQFVEKNELMNKNSLVVVTLEWPKLNLVLLGTPKSEF